MKIEQIVTQRFKELEQKASEITAKRKFDFQADDGTNYYNIDSADVKAWATSVLNLLQRIFLESSIHYQNFYAHYNSFSGYESEFQDLCGIFRAAQEDYAGGYLFNARGLIQAEVVDSVIEQSAELLQAGYKDPACVVVGVALETTLKELSTRNTIAHGKLDRMNTDLCKAGVYNMGMQKQITAWAEHRNNAAHGNWSAYSKSDVEDMIGV